MRVVVVAAVVVFAIGCTPTRKAKPPPAKAPPPACTALDCVDGKCTLDARLPHMVRVHGTLLDGGAPPEDSEARVVFLDPRGPPPDRTFGLERGGAGSLQGVTGSYDGRVPVGTWDIYVSLNKLPAGGNPVAMLVPFAQGVAVDGDRVLDIDLHFANVAVPSSPSAFEYVLKKPNDERVLARLYPAFVDGQSILPIYRGTYDVFRNEGTLAGYGYDFLRVVGLGVTVDGADDQLLAADYANRTVSGALTLDGAAWPAGADGKIEITVAKSAAAAEATILSVPPTGSYSVAIPSATVDIFVALPLGDVVARRVDVAADTAVDFAIQTTHVALTVSLDGAPRVQPLHLDGDTGNFVLHANGAGAFEADVPRGTYHASFSAIEPLGDVVIDENGATPQTFSGSTVTVNVGATAGGQATGASLALDGQTLSPSTTLVPGTFAASLVYPPNAIEPDYALGSRVVDASHGLLIDLPVAELSGPADANTRVRVNNSVGDASAVDGRYSIGVLPGAHDVVVDAGDLGWTVPLAHCARFDAPTRP